MPAIFRIRREYDELWEDQQQAPARSRSRRAVELDERDRARASATAIGEQTGRKVELHLQRRARHPRRHRRPRRQPDPRRLHPQPPRDTFASRSPRPPERSQGATDTPMQIKPDEITSILKSRIEGLDAGQAELTEVGTVLSVADGIARIHGLENCMSFEMLELPARRHRPRAEPRVRQRRRRALRRLGARSTRATRSSAPAASSRSRSATALLGRIVDPLGQPARRQGRHQPRASAARPSSRRRASSSASRSRSRCRPASRRSTR